MADGISLREFGARLNVTGEAVRKAIATGRIPADCVGMRELRGGRKWPVIIDPDRAAKAWGYNTDPTAQRDNAQISATKKATRTERSTVPPTSSRMDIPSLSDPPRPPTITESKAIAEAYKARLLKLEYDEKAGKLVSADTVKIEVATMIATVRTRLLGVPSKAKQRIPHLSRADVVEIEELIRDALEELANYGGKRV